MREAVVRPICCLFLLAVSVLLLPGCQPRFPDDQESGPAPAGAVAREGLRFTDVSEQAGLSFVHDHGGSGEKYLPETMGSGGGFLDFDGDGWLDVVLLSGSPQGTRVARAPTAASIALYRNRGDGTFADVTVGSGLEKGVYAMGCAVGDYDRDGWDDLFVTTVGAPNLLFRNEGGGRFREVGRAMGVDDPRWGTSCAFLDYDRDGWLDLFVCNYVEVEVGVNDRCPGADGRPMYCHPDRLPASRCALYRNEGGRYFRDVSGTTGIGQHPAKALGVVTCDVDGDGWIDLVVANDKMPNRLYRNRGDGTFAEVGLTYGVAYSENGQMKAGMGIDAADVDNNGRLAVLVSNFHAEALTLFQQDLPPAFLDTTFQAGFGESSLPYLGFGLCFFDYDNDGRQDACVVNGHIEPDVALYQRGVTYAQRNLLYHNEGEGRFAEVGLTAGKPFQQSRVSRGLAFGDFDNDGDLDLLVTNNGGPAELLRNDGGNQRPWLQLELAAPHGGPGGLGARVEIRAGGQRQRQWVRSGGSYLSASMSRLHFGLGAAQQVDTVTIHWPSGSVQTLKSVPANQRLVVQEP